MRHLPQILAAAIILTAVTWSNAASSPRATTTKPAAAALDRNSLTARNPNASPLAKIISAQADATLDSATRDSADNPTWSDAQTKARAAFALAVAYGAKQDVDAFTQADYVYRLLSQLQSLSADQRRDLLVYLRAHEDIARLLVFSIRDENDIPAVYQIFDNLRRQRTKQLEALPALAVAISVVRDHKFEVHLNGKVASPPEVLPLFDFYVAHERQMLFGLRDMPVELLQRVVDFAGTMDDMNWAFRNYAGTADIGHLYFLLAYDYDYFEGKAPSKVQQNNLSLPNLLKLGGVCIDRAYFAASVGKTIGVPTVIDYGASADAGHAWVGYFQAYGNFAHWNFDAGRFGAYLDLRGSVRDNQADHPIPDQTAALATDILGTTLAQRQSAIAFTDAAKMLLGPLAIPAPADSSDSSDARPRRRKREAADKAGNDKNVSAATFVAPPLPSDLPKSAASSLASPRTPNSDGALDLISLALHQQATCLRAWELVTTLAVNDQLSDAQKKTWASLTQRFCGDSHPDFALSVVEPMIKTVKDPALQSGLWDTEFTILQKRLDLAAKVRMSQAAMWESRSDYNRAGQCYEDVIHRFINSGPFALKAVQGAERILTQMNQSNKVLDLYALAYKLVAKPDADMGPEFVKGSNWFKIRKAYADKLESAGQTQLASNIRNDNNAALGGK